MSSISSPTSHTVKAKINGLALQGALLFILWVAFCWQGITTAISIWWGNEIFNHGFFIVPGAFYLIYLKRSAIFERPIQHTYLALIVIVPAMLLYIVGLAGDVRLFLHVATFVLLPALVWFLVGSKAARVIVFPLFFMLFSIPIGEQLIPYLQEIAADGSVVLLQLSGVPLYRNGLYIEIPQGRFLVAEACSGVSFFIASFVIGSLYSYLNLYSIRRRSLFVIISLIFPVIANIVRVYGIIYIAYLTDMEYAAGADHLIYGWFFFAFVIVCLLGLGELMREKHPPQGNVGSPTHSIKADKVKLAVIFLLFGVALIWSDWINNNTLSVNPSTQPVYGDLPGVNTNTCLDRINLPPSLSRPSKVNKHSFSLTGPCDTLVVDAWFDGVNNELVSSLNRLYSVDSWSRMEGVELSVKNSDTQYLFKGEKITSPSGATRYVTFWYVINGRIFENDVEAKLYQIYLAMLGQPVSGSLVYVSSSNGRAFELMVRQLVQATHEQV